MSEFLNSDMFGAFGLGIVFGMLTTMGGVIVGEWVRNQALRRERIEDAIQWVEDRKAGIADE